MLWLMDQTQPVSGQGRRAGPAETRRLRVFARVPVRGVEVEAVFADARGEATVVRSDRLSPDGFGEGGCRLLGANRTEAFH